MTVFCVSFFIVENDPRKVPQDKQFITYTKNVTFQSTFNKTFTLMKTVLNSFLIEAPFKACDANWNKTGYYMF